MGLRLVRPERRRIDIEDRDGRCRIQHLRDAGPGHSAGRRRLVGQGARRKNISRKVTCGGCEILENHFSVTAHRHEQGRVRHHRGAGAMVLQGRERVKVSRHS